MTLQAPRGRRNLSHTNGKGQQQHRAEAGLVCHGSFPGVQKNCHRLRL